jgi:replicative DNA helicase
MLQRSVEELTQQMARAPSAENFQSRINLLRDKVDKMRAALVGAENEIRQKTDSCSSQAEEIRKLLETVKKNQEATAEALLL